MSTGFQCRFSTPMPLDKDNKACEIRTCSFARPHMRGFWFATIGFFVAFVGWFHMAPLASTIRKEVGLTKSEWYNSNILAVSATIFARVLIGPACDRFGARRCMAFLLLFAAPALACAAAVTNAGGVYITRTLIGCVGATFVPCQFWCTQMFTGTIVGQANAMAGGWGNLGGGVTQATAPGLYEMFKAMGLNDNAAWRVSLQVPAVVWVVVAVCMWLFSDDCPEGHWNNRKLVGGSAGTLGQGLKEVCSNYVVWILVANYACCFGVELYVNNSMSSYLQEMFGVEQFVAGLITSLFGLMNLFARAIGGWLSDRMAARFALRGRMWVILVTILGCGGMLVIFSRIRVLWLAIIVLVIFSCFVQAAEGATFGLVPFVNKRYTGIVSGFVGAGGNLGAMSWGFVHKAFGENDQEDVAFLVVGFICGGVALSMLLVRMHGASAIPCFGNDGSEWLAEQEKDGNADEFDYGYGYDMGMFGYGDFMPTPMSTPAAMYPSPYYSPMVPMGMPY